MTVNKKYPKGWLLKVYIDAEIFQELFEDNDDYIINEKSIQEYFFADQNSKIITKNLTKRNNDDQKKE